LEKRKSDGGLKVENGTRTTGVSSLSPPKNGNIGSNTQRKSSTVQGPQGILVPNKKPAVTGGMS
jgi:hypothetical protein